METKTKICSRCRKEKSYEHFAKCSASNDGLQYICKECMSEIMRENYAKRKQSGKKDDPKEQSSSSTLLHVFSNPELAKFKPRELIEELKARGYHGKLTYTNGIVL